MTFSSTREPFTLLAGMAAAATTTEVLVALESIKLSIPLPELASMPTEQPSNLNAWAVAWRTLARRTPVLTSNKGSNRQQCSYVVVLHRYLGSSGSYS